jgi:uncharacterized protein (TIGR03083 family)
MTAATTEADLQPRITTEFLALADTLSSVTNVQWDTPSLCEGWRIREVVAHLTMPARYSQDEFMAELRACGFDFSLLSNTIAARDATLPSTELLANLNSEVLHRWTPPEGGQLGALNHVVIHSLDATLPLATPRRVDRETIRIILDALTIGGVHDYFGTTIDGRRLEATDMDWAHGTGRSLRGPADELALVLCGRTLTRSHLEGQPLS